MAQAGDYNRGGRGPTDAIAFPNIHQLFGDGADASIAKIRGSVNAWAALQAHNALSAAALEKIFKVQAGTIIDDLGTGQSREVCFTTHCWSPVAPVSELLLYNDSPECVNSP